MTYNAASSMLDLELLAAEWAAAESLSRRLSRWGAVLWYYRKSQLARRALNVAARLVDRRSPARLAGMGEPSAVGWCPPALQRMNDLARLRKPRSLPSTEPVSGDSHSHLSPSGRSTGEVTLRLDLESGRFCLLNEPWDLGSPTDWTSQTAMPVRRCEAKTPPQRDHPADNRPVRLWQFHLHYQEYLRDLMAWSVGDETADKERDAIWVTIWRIVDSWLERGISDRDNAWHPYCVSRRLPVWFDLAAVGQVPSALEQRFLGSCLDQAEHLARHLELDIGGNHLLENLTTLLLACCLLDTPRAKRWSERAKPLFERELGRQVLASGEFFERAPTYHCQVLGNIMRLAYVSAERLPEVSALCRRAANPMWRFLRGILHPDGEIPLFADSGFNEAPSVAELASWASLLGLDATESSAVGSSEAEGGRSQLTAHNSQVVGDYWTWRRDADFVIVDAGPLGARELPSHSHCDLGSLEVSIGGERLIVDSGNFDYEAGSMRRYCRSSLAHNVVTIDGHDHADVWSRFRMGHRGSIVRFESGVGIGQDTTQQDAVAADDASWCELAHNAYRRLGVAASVRRVDVRDSSKRRRLRCVDSFEAAGSHTATGFLHFAPGVTVDRQSDFSFTVEAPRRTCIVEFRGAEQVDVAAGWHCPEFGRRMRTQVLVYSAPLSVALRLEWEISWDT